MNFLRGSVRRSSDNGGAEEASGGAGKDGPDRSLTLMHMRKLFSELSQSHLNSSEYEQKFTRIFPLFLKVMQMYAPEELPSVFKEMAPFTGHVAKLFVQEIRKRASNQSTEAAALAIVEFVEPPDDKILSPTTPQGTVGGWFLLVGLDFLIRSGVLEVSEAACKASLPSTLAKAVYLFFDLPAPHGLSPSALQRRVVLQDRFVDIVNARGGVLQLLTKLCSQSCAGEELARKDDLRLLFAGASSWCPQHNVSWRKVTSQLLMTISSRILTQTLIKYINSKHCIGHFIENLRQSGAETLRVAERADMIVCLFCVIKDSANVTPVLEKDLKEANGYQFLVNFILEHETEESVETMDALRNLLLMFSSVVAAGYKELKPPSLNSNLYNLPGFSLPQPQGQGCSVRNIDAFQVLEQVFLKSRKAAICSTLLDVINSIYSADPANYFILEKHCTLGQFAERIHTKAKDVQLKFFELLEYIVFHLNYIPCKEFISLCILLKTQTSVSCSILCVQSLFRILTFNPVIKDVYREVGLVETLVSILQQYVNVISEKGGMGTLQSKDKTLVLLIMDMLTMTLKGNCTNATVFREIGGGKCVHSLLMCAGVEEWRPGMLQLIQQLLMLPGGDEELSALLGLLHSSASQQMQLKVCLLKALLCVLRESHRVRMTFRRVGGYLYLMSLLLTLEGSLSQTPKPPWDTFLADQSESEEPILTVIDLLQLIFKVLTISMRFEPANAKFFQTEVRFSSLMESLRLTGAFGERAKLKPTTELKAEDVKDQVKMCHKVFELQLEEKSILKDIPVQLVSVNCILKLLYNMALDSYEKASLATTQDFDKSPQISNGSLFSNPPESIIVHTGAVISILDLLPSISFPEPKWELGCQLFAAEILKCLVRTERNQQVMCEAGLPRRLFSVAVEIFRKENHILLSSFYYILERLSAQGMQPRELREFLRLDVPLCCRSLDGEDEKEVPPTEGGPVPLTRIKALVSMMTPRDYRIAGVSSSPPFVEFDMSIEGFGCIFLPSVAPSGYSTLSVSSGGGGGGEGGVGSGDRVFPPLTGLSFLSWVYVERFSNRVADAHPIRLLTVVRTLPQKNPTNRRNSALAEFLVGDRAGSSPVSPYVVELSCLTIQISPLDHSLLIGTHESDTPGADLERDAGPNDSFARIPIPELEEERQWFHLAIVFTRAVLKQSTVSVYVNGRLATTQKLHYVVQNPGGGATTLAQATGVHSVIGTPPGPLRKQSKLLWRLGTAYMVEDALPPEVLLFVYNLGPAYTGCFQSPVLPCDERIPTLMTEEKISFGIHAQATSQMTLAKLRRVYNKTDSRSVAKYLGISTHENATPIRVLHNSAGHLNGPSRTLGGVLIGYLGMRTFCPQPVAKLLESVGGVSAILGLIAMSKETEGLYASLKALLCAIRNNRNISNYMNSCRGYQTLAVLLEEKSRLLNSHILHLIFSLSGTLDSSRDNTTIPNQQAFEDLLCDLDVWKLAPAELQRLLYEHFYEIITENAEHKQNLKIIRQSGLLSRLLFRLANDPKQLRSTKDVIFNLLAAILQPPTDSNSLLRYLCRFGQFIAYLLPLDTPGDAEKKVPFEIRDVQSQLFSDADDALNPVTYKVYVRNRCINILLNTLLHTSGSLNLQLCEHFVKVLGFDWVMALLGYSNHEATIWAGLRIVLALTAHPPLLLKFREGTGTSGWLAEAESVVQNRAGTVLGFSVSAHGGSVGSACDINPEICHLPGFVALQQLLPCHASLADCYLALLSILVGQPSKELHHLEDFTLDCVWSVVFGLPHSHSVAEAIAKIELCPDAVLPLLAMVRHAFQSYSPAEEDNSWSRKYPQTVLQFLNFLYHNVSEFTTFCSGEEFLTGLMATLFRDNQLQSVDGAENAEDFVLVIPKDCSGTSSPDKEPINHPCRKTVIEFLKSILVDSFHNVPPTKGDSVTDVLLELMPESSTKKEQSGFVTELVNGTMEHLLASDVLLCGQSSSLPLTAGVVGNSYGALATNVFYFTSRLVDCLWNGTYTGDPHVLFEFLLKLLNQLKRKSGGVSTDPLIHSLNRTLLFMLCKPIDNVQSQLNVLESLHRITSNRNVVFASNSNDAEFLGCLAHLLFMLSVTPQFSTSSSSDTQSFSDEQQRLHDGCALVQAAAHRVWEEMYLAKKQILEEKFKTSLVPEINAARALAGEPANRYWQAFVDSEMRGPSRDLNQIHQQLQSKIQKISSGIQRFASRKNLVTKAASLALSAGGSGNTSGVNTPITGISATNLVTRSNSIPAQTLGLWMKVHLSLIRELFRLQAAQYSQWHEHVQKWCLGEWHSVEQELTRERGLWGPETTSRLDKWSLDTTEGPCRMRKKLVPNPFFYLLYPYRPNLDLTEYKALKCKVALSKDSRLYHDRMKLRRSRTMDSRIIDTSTSVATPSEEKQFLFKDMRDVNPSMIRRASTVKPPEEGSSESEKTLEKMETVNEEDAKDSPEEEAPGTKELTADKTSSTEKRTQPVSRTGSGGNPEQPIPTAKQRPDNQTLLRLLEEGEELVSMFRCARIEGLDTCEGLLLFGKEHYYVVDGYTLLKTREIRDLDFLPESLHDPIVPYTATGTARPQGQKRCCVKFPYEDVREVHKRRYLLQPIALEVFSGDGRNYLLAFPKKTRNKVYSKFISVAKSLTDSGALSVSGQRSSVNLEQSGGSSLFSSLIGETNVTQRWVRGETSNFQYLMHLNTLAGRSYNDLSQYPVFPWVLADYDSEELDLTSLKTFRDLSKPMGAQTPDRLEQFMKRYREWDDPTGETPPYMYGTHYSSAMIVVSYLVRAEPFSQQFLKLQGGHFDLADRMFHSIREGWLSASKNNMADVKELIPEFFYLPQFLKNDNNFDLGVKQSGVGLADVILPPWAKGDAREFIRVHREALESDYVSAHLHEWIDLIFGYKQQGQSAIEAQNLFHHLFYEGNVDFEAIDDPLTRNATIGFINNFGQIPTQLFKKAHPPKKLPPNSFLSKSAVGLTPLPDPSLPTPGVTTDTYFFHAIDSLKPPALPLKDLKGAVGQITQNEKGQLLAVEQNKILLPPNYNRYLAWGFADRSIRLGNYDTDKSSCIFELADCGDIVCASSPNSRTVVTGSTNTVVSVWELTGGKYRSTGGYAFRLRKSLYGHTEPITCIAASGSYGVVVSGSRDCTCIVWDLSNYSFIRQLPSHPFPVSAVAINDATGDIGCCAGTFLHLWSINGELLASVNTASSPTRENKDILLCIAFSTLNEWDPEHVVITGSSEGIVKLWCLEYVQVSESDASHPNSASEELPSLCGLTSSELEEEEKTKVFTPALLQQKLHETRFKLNSWASSMDTPTEALSRGWSVDVSPESASPLPLDSGIATPNCQRSFSYNSNDSAHSSVNRASSNDSFVFVNREGMTVLKTSNRLKPGFTWQKQLVFRTKLTIHTAFQRKDNPAPAPITAIAPSKDHKTLYVGDGKGRVWGWVVGDAVVGGRADHWVQDLARSSCTQCHQRFTVAERKHHCRNCGQIFCARCSRFETELRHMKITKPVRVCQNCFVRLKAENP